MPQSLSSTNVSFSVVISYFIRKIIIESRTVLNISFRNDEYNINQAHWFHPREGAVNIQEGAGP